jgi:hypothetical protein
MSQEIIYTSAPSGIKPGSRGFCTVVATHGMAKNLTDQLEELSGYRHLFLSGPEAAKNPVVFSHVRVPTGGRPYHILSRVSDAGLDYTQRTNKLAHHVALDTGELPAAGPAWLLLQPGWMAAGWSGAPHVRPAGPVVPAGDVRAAPCRAWQRVAGDAGWAGVVAGELSGDSRKPIVVVYRAGVEMLPLVAEVVAMLPAARRWSVTFSTYVTKLAPTIDCRWRFFVDGTPEAESALRQAGALVLDLRRPLGKPAEAPHVAAARTGRQLAMPTVVARPRPAAGDLDELELLLAEEKKVKETKRPAAAAQEQAPIYGTAQPVYEMETIGVFENAPPLPQAPRRNLGRLALSCVIGLSIIALSGATTWWLMRRAETLPDTGARAAEPIATPTSTQPVKAKTPPTKAGDDDDQASKQRRTTAAGAGAVAAATALKSGTTASTPVSPSIGTATNPKQEVVQLPPESPPEIHAGKLSTKPAEFKLPGPWNVDSGWTMRFKPLYPPPKTLKHAESKPGEPLVLNLTNGFVEQNMASFSIKQAGVESVLRYAPSPHLGNSTELLETLSQSALLLKSPGGDEKLVAFWELQPKSPATLGMFVQGTDGDPAKTFDVPARLSSSVRVDPITIDGAGVECEVVSTEGKSQFQLKLPGGRTLAVRVEAVRFSQAVTNGNCRMSLVVSIADEKIRSAFPELSRSSFSLRAFTSEYERLESRLKDIGSEIANKVNFRTIYSRNSADAVKLAGVNDEIAQLQSQRKDWETKIRQLTDAYGVITSASFKSCRIQARVCLSLDDRTAAIAQF